jgi:cysteine desulfuration protein SufE
LIFVFHLGALDIVLPDCVGGAREMEGWFQIGCRRGFLSLSRPFSATFVQNSDGMTIQEIQDEIIGEFEFLGDWEDKYEYIIALGKEAAAYPEQFRDEEHKVRGCQSQVWLHHEIQGDRIHFWGDSDAMIPKGLIALLLRIYQDQPIAEIATADLYFLNKIGLSQNLSPTRSNGLASMAKRIKMIGVENS